MLMECPQASSVSQYFFVSLSILRYQILLQCTNNCIPCFGKDICVIFLTEKTMFENKQGCYVNGLILLPNLPDI